MAAPVLVRKVNDFSERFITSQFSGSEVMLTFSVFDETNEIFVACEVGLDDNLKLTVIGANKSPASIRYIDTSNSSRFWELCQVWITMRDPSGNGSVNSKARIYSRLMLSIAIINFL